MTVLVGIICNDGLVIASDSQESSEYMKRLDVRKIYDSTREVDDFELDDAHLIVAGSGPSAHISRFVEELDQRILAPDFLWPRDVADVAEESMRALHERYSGYLNMSFGVLLGVFCANAPKDDNRRSPLGLFTVGVPGVAARVDDYASMGSGSPFASYLLHRLHDVDNPTTAMTVDAAIREAIYVVEETKKVQLHCGGGHTARVCRERGIETQITRRD